MKKIREFFMNRYGMDSLNRALMVLYIIFLIISLITRHDVFMYISLGIVVYQVYRALSRNFTARTKENQVFIKFWNPIKRKYYSIKKKITDKTHRYFKCPKCKTEIRVPKNKGKIRITCPKCSEQFIKNT
jgi:ribosomal protein L37AE/L43A